MNSKFLLTFAVLAIAICGASCYVMMDGEEADAANVTVTFVASPSNGGHFYSYGQSGYVTSLTVPTGTTFTSDSDGSNGRISFSNSERVDAVPYSGYLFSSLSPSSGTVSGNMTITATFSGTTTVSFVASPSNGGTVSITSTVEVPIGAPISVSGNTVYVGDRAEVTATPNRGYLFDSWSPSSGSVSSPTTITARFVDACTVSFVASPSNGGTVSQSYVDVPYGTTFDTIAHIFRIDGKLITANASNDYGFSGWSQSRGTITDDVTITANFYYALVTVSFVASPSNGGHFYSYGQSGYVTSLTVPTGTTFTSDSDGSNGRISFSNSERVDAVPYSGYLFSSLSPSSGTVSGNMTITATFSGTTTVSFVASPSNGGTVSITSTVEVPIGAPISVSGNTVYVGDRAEVTATPNAGYTFNSWNPSSGTITGPTTITANFVSDDMVNWTNDNYNGKIDIIFNFDGNGTQEITGDLFTGSSSAGVANWSFTGLTVKTFVEKSGNQTRVGAELLQGSTVIKTNATGGSWPNVGSWDALQVSIDPENAQVVFTPVSVLNSFTDYKLYSTQARTMLSWGEVLESSAIRTLQHEASGDAPRFSVVGTRVFLDTYNAVLFDPRINVREKFPQYDSVRLNFYSFALYGDSMTVNGYTYPVTGDKITITYVDQDGTHYAVGAVPGGEQRTRDFTLSNIYVSWDSLTGHCTLTFVNDRWTLDMGEYTHQVVSFAGMWYFYTMLYDSHVTQDKSLGDWKTLPETNQSQMVLIYLGILAVAGTAGLIHIRRGGHATLDLIVIGCAGIVGYILLG